MTEHSFEVTSEDFDYLIQKLPNDVDLMIVGGQALSFWSELYLPKYPEEFASEEGLVSTTSDIDFVGSRLTAEKCAKAWNAEIEFPNAHDVVTPNTALVKVEIPNKGIIVLDFLKDYVSYSSLRNDNDERVYLNERQTISILGPIATLLSRMANVTILHRRDDHAIGQLKTALVITRCVVREHLGYAEISQAQKILNLILHIANKDHMGKPLYRQFGIDLLKTIPNDLDGLHTKFVSSLQIKAEEIVQKRNQFDQRGSACNN